jgi:hypothetical protein
MKKLLLLVLLVGLAVVAMKALSGEHSHGHTI